MADELLPAMVNHAFANHGQRWLTKVSFHKPMVDHGFGKLCQPWLTMICDVYVKSSKLSMVNHGYKYC